MGARGSGSAVIAGGSRTTTVTITRLPRVSRSRRSGLSAGASVLISSVSGGLGIRRVLAWMLIMITMAPIRRGRPIRCRPGVMLSGLPPMMGAVAAHGQRYPFGPADLSGRDAVTVERPIGDRLVSGENVPHVVSTRGLLSRYVGGGRSSIQVRLLCTTTDATRTSIYIRLVARCSCSTRCGWNRRLLIALRGRCISVHLRWVRV